MSHESRNSRTFKLNAEQLERAQFEAATEAETAPLDQYQRIESHTPILPKRVKRALVALALIVGAVLVADVVSLVNQLNQLHWFAGLSSGALFGALALYALVSLIRWVRGSDSVKQMEALQIQAARMRHAKGLNQRQTLVENLLSFYKGKQQEGTLRNAIDAIPDYANDAEVLEHLESQFLGPLDSQADKLIQRYSLQTGLSVAASPLPVLDILLTLWRCQILIMELSELYGVQPSLANRLRILVSVLRAMAYSGLTETSIGLADLSNIPLGQLGARTAQGLGAAVATARLGLVAARLCRPVPANTDERSVFKKLASAVLVLLGKKILGR